MTGKESKSSSSSSGSDTENYSSDYSSSSDDVTEDEDGNELTPALDAAILSTLSKIKKGQGVYDGAKVLEEELKRAQERAEQKGLNLGRTRKMIDKPFFLQDYHRNKLLLGVQDEDEEPLTHVQSEQLLRQEAVNAFHSLVENSDDFDDEFIKKREKDAGDKDQGDQDYREFLLEMGGGEDEVRKLLGMGDQPAVLEILEEEEKGEIELENRAVLSKVEKEEMEKNKAERHAKKAKNDDDFLMNYILNRGWIDESSKHVPTYDEIVGSTKLSKQPEESVTSYAEATNSHPWGRLDELEDFEDRAEQFETEYNFRFEEPGAATITTHPRDIPSLVRRSDDARKTKRAHRAERKAVEKAAQEEGIRRKKKEKRKEMEKRMSDLKHNLEREGVKGIDWIKLENLLDGEWDETIWEKAVGEILAGGRDGSDEGDNEKPTWDDDLGDDYEQNDQDDSFPYNQAETNADNEEEHNPNKVDEGPINMDADFPSDEPKSKKSKKDKKTSKARLRSLSPILQDSSLSISERAVRLKETVASYNALSHEDIIGDMPTRFKYTTAAPASFGLSPAEILLATDEELNQLVSMKTIAPYRKGGIGIQGKGLGKRVRELKDRLKDRRWGEQMSKETRLQGQKRKRDNVEDSQNRQVGSEKGEDREDRTIEGQHEKSEKKRSGKRLGKKERLKLQRTAETIVSNSENVDETPPKKSKLENDHATSINRQKATDDESEENSGKKKRRKKRRLANEATI
ncbi:hypothetical protein L204_106204 [Cryptococcus depauperatus]|nr:protein KRI1 [Cryptococcus depauperatus CBS 7855]